MHNRKLYLTYKKAITNKKDNKKKQKKSVEDYYFIIMYKYGNKMDVHNLEQKYIYMTGGKAGLIISTVNCVHHN